MKLPCNIDQRGKKARLVGGMMVDLCGVAMILTGLFTRSRRPVVGGISLCVIGSFMVFEGARGWCALRSMGLKTPL